MTNVKRSVERVKGVEKVTIDLKTGVGRVTFTARQKPETEALWRAVEESGFTPTKIELRGLVYRGPEH